MTVEQDVRIADHRVSEQVPDHVVASCLYDSRDWLRGWERNDVETWNRHCYVSSTPEGPASVLPVYETTWSPFWHGYEVQCTLSGRFGSPVVFAGSPYFMYSKRGPLPASLARGAVRTAMEWIENGPADLLVVPNLTAQGVADWKEAVGEPVGTVLLERTYSCDLESDLWTDLRSRVPGKARRDLERRVRRSEERGLRVRMIDGPDARALVPRVYPLTVDTSEKNEWPPLFTQSSLDEMLCVPGAMLLVAEVDDRLLGAFFAFRNGTEVTYMCGGVDYSTLHEFSTYVALMVGGNRWAYENGMDRVEWGRDNYRFKEKHGLDATDLWALVYSPTPRPDLVPALEHMHAVLSAYIEGDE